MHSRRLLAGGAVASLWVGRASAQVPAGGIHVLEREKSLAEQFLTLLNEFGRKDVGQYARGITLYAAAKAEFDGLISELEHELRQTQPPDRSATFQTVLNGAVDKRVAFTSFVSDTILPQAGGTAKGIGDFIRVVPELVKALTDAGISIWREFRSAGEARREEMRKELEGLRWPPFKP
ncbi:MAG TPA: hypothetical protein VKI44_36695 [Acetobacteraceae bacterium]|nr:hypothetical protein [Acetobacteraceae bacterium]